MPLEACTRGATWAIMSACCSCLFSHHGRYRAGARYSTSSSFNDNDRVLHRVAALQNGKRLAAGHRYPDGDGHRLARVSPPAQRRERVPRTGESLVLEILAGTDGSRLFRTHLTPRFAHGRSGTPQVFNGLSAGDGFADYHRGVDLRGPMYAVPRPAGGAMLGATKYEVSTRVVVPAALSGIIAAFVLGISRAIGETMIVLIAAGGTPNLTLDPTKAMQTMTAFIGAAGIGDQATGSIGYKTIFAVGITLFVMTLIMNIISIRLVRKYREVYD